MNPNFQSSFIPKEPVSGEVFKKKKAGVFGVLAVSIFITVIVASGGLFAYKTIIKGEIENLQTQIAESEKSIDKKTISEMSQFNKKLAIARLIIVKHQIMTRFLEDLASSTVSSIQFTNFTYGNTINGGLSVNLKGKANSYASIALQENIFSNNKNFKSVSFSGLSLGEKGTVGFDVSILVDPKILNYNE